MNRARRDEHEDCRYRALYEGSQASLNDLASKHTTTLGRVVTLRAGIVGLLKQVYPTQLLEAERALGHKLGTASDPDSVVLTYLESFVRAGGATRRGLPPAGLEDLRAALAAHGLMVTGSDLGQWAATIRAEGPRTVAPPPAAPAVPADSVPSKAAAAPDEPGVDAPPPWDDGGAGWDDNLDALFQQDPGADPGEDLPWDLGDLFGQDPHEDAPASPEIEDLFGPGEVPPPARKRPATPPAPRPEPAPAPEPAPERDAAVPEPAPAAGPKGPVAPTQEGVLRPQTPAPAPVKAPRRPARQRRVTATPPEAEAPADVATDRFAELFDKVAALDPVFTSDLVTSSGSPALVAAWEQHFQDMGTDSPVRAINPRAHHRARGALLIPSGELRDRQVQAGTSVWTQCLADGPDRPRLRGARLYEAGVLLSRYGSQVVSHSFGSDTLTLRLNTQQGLVAVVMWLGSDAPTGPGRSDLTDAVGSVISDRLSLLAVLTHETGDRALERLVAVVAEDAAERGWSPTMPVVAAHAWEFATDAGASALAVL